MATECAPIVCSLDCEDPIPDASFDLCNPEVNFGEVDAIFITNIGNPLVDETDLAEITTRLALLAANPARIQELQVVGSRPVPEKTSVTIARNIEVNGTKSFVLNFEIHQTNKINYEFMRSFECAKKVLIWYRTAGGLWYGGAAGIEVTISLDEDVPLSRKELIKFIGTAKWDSKFSPCRSNSVI